MDWSGSYHCLRLHRLWSFLRYFIIDFVLTHNGLEWLVSLIFYNGSLLLTMARILSYKLTQVHLCVNGAIFSTDSSLRLTIAKLPSRKLISVSMVQFSPLIFFTAHNSEIFAYTNSYKLIFVSMVKSSSLMFFCCS